MPQHLLFIQREIQCRIGSSLSASPEWYAVARSCIVNTESTKIHLKSLTEVEVDDAA